jgi:hypothetical protein
MTCLDALGYLAAGLVLATFCAKSMLRLRILAIGSNLAFLTYAIGAGLWPILLLHAVMLPLNLLRLRQVIGELSPEPGLDSDTPIRHAAAMAAAACPSIRLIERAGPTRLPASAVDAR